MYGYDIVTASTLKLFIVFIIKSFFMELTQQILKEYSSHLKNIKYKGIVQDVKLEHCTDIDDDNLIEGDQYVILRLIRIRKPMRNKGFGSIVLKDIINFADRYNIKIILYASEKYGSDIKGLYRFYEKFGFVKVANDIDHKMLYHNVLIKTKYVVT
jgi:GNAT superfamily N-acetyltransferase